MTRYVSFDLEIAKQLPNEERDLLKHRPLGISCAATMASGTREAQTWYSRDTNGHPSSQMTRDDAIALVRYLQERVGAGDSIATWNGLKFDFVVLADESGLEAECRELARVHVDMMFHFFCIKGFPVSLEKSAEGMQVSPKSKAVSGAMAPSLWSEGKYEEILSYVSQDAMTTLELAEACATHQKLTWVTSKGSKSAAHLPQGWLPVEQARKLALPDTSWMDSSIPRASFTDWLDGISGG
jgi:hypothetical protein